MIKILKLIIITAFISINSIANNQMISGEVIQVNNNTVQIKVLDIKKVHIGNKVNLYYKTLSGKEMKIGEWKVLKVDNKIVYANAVDIYMPPSVGLIAKITFSKKDIGQDYANGVSKPDSKDIYKVQVDTKRNHINPWSSDNYNDKDISVDPQQYVDKAKKMADDLYKHSKKYSKEEIKTLWNEVIYNIYKAISMDNAEAYWLLALVYEDGYGDIKSDLGKMIDNITKSAEKGYVEAQYMLGEMYADGDEVVKDKEKAIYWLKKAVAQNHKDAKYELKKLMKARVKEQPSNNDNVNDLYDLLD